MKPKLLLLTLLFLTVQLNAQDLKYYLPDSVSYDKAIPVPKDVIFHEVGEYHVTHDRLVNYMQVLAKAAPGRIKIETIGYTYEQRPQVLLTITSPANHKRLEEIRQQHLALSNPDITDKPDVSKMPVVIWMGYSIHGNEQSGSNAALVAAYYFAAAQGNEIEKYLENSVILFDPSFNPDGMQRFSTWVNQHKSKNLVTDPNSREFSEVWPGGRFNHYWFDLNRDWLPVVHPESKNRLAVFQKWKPNVLTDHHEMGSNSSFFFQPGVPSRVNANTPKRNQEITALLGNYHAAFLNRIGSLYFTKESYDDFYYGKGSTYPDVNGGVGILFEQGSSRGHAQETDNGVLSFPFTIRNQFVTTLSTLAGANAYRQDLLNYQQEFYKNAQQEAAAFNGKAFVYGDENDKGRTQIFTDILLRHHIKVHPVTTPIKADGILFKPGTSYVVPVKQAQFKLIKAIFERTLQYQDSLFYDITSWTMPLAFGLPSALLTEYSTAHVGTALKEAPLLNGMVEGTESHYAYMVSWSELYAPAFLYKLLQNGLQVKVATKKTVLPVNGVERIFPAGSLMIPVAQQKIQATELFSQLKQLAQQTGITVTAVTTGAAVQGNDLGSNSYVSLRLPRIAMLTGPGVNALDAGEIWHLMDQRMNIPITQLEPAAANRVDFKKYTHLIMADGTYRDLNKDKIKDWVQAGGSLIVMEEAVNWAATAGISSVGFKKKKEVLDSTKKISYGERQEVSGSQRMSGAIFEATADLTHPVTYGYTTNKISVFKANSLFMELPRISYQAPLVFGDNPLQSGWLSRENYAVLKKSAAIIINRLGQGRVINIADNPNLRGFWLGGTKLLMNSIFFDTAMQ